jgi:outer membrane protein assembly factor BamB
VFLETCLAIACFAGAPDAPDISLEEAQANLTMQLIERVHLSARLGDGLSSARALTLLAAVATDPAYLKEAGYALLDVFTNTGLPADTRARIISREPEEYRAAVEQVIGAFARTAGDYPLPDGFKGWKRLGPESGCPVTHALAFAEGPKGRITMLGNGLTVFDGKRWQRVAPDAIRVHKPVDALYVDGAGRTWLGSVSGGELRSGVVGRLRRYNWGSIAYYQRGPKMALMPGRWHVFAGNDRVTSFAEGKRGVWVAARSRIFLFKDGRMLPVGLPLPYSPVRWLVAWPDSDDVWVVDADRISRFDGQQWQSFKLSGMSRPVAAPVRQKDQAVVPIGSGFLRLKRDSTKLFTMSRKPKGVGEITSVSVAPDGALWSVTNQGHVLRLADAVNWEIFRRPKAMAAPARRPAIFCDSKGRSWLSRGNGIELCLGAPGEAGKVVVSGKAINARQLEVALVSFAGSGGWVEDGVALDLPDPDAADPVTADDGPPPVDDLGGFHEDEAIKEDSAEGALKALRKTPTSPALYQKLQKYLVKKPDPAIRRAGLIVAASGRNSEFLGKAKDVRELARLLLDEPKRPPIDACVLLLEAMYQKADTRYRRALEPTLFEALVRMGFGEFARPEFFSVEVAGVLGGRPKLVSTLKRPALSGAPKTPLTLRTYELDVDENGRKELAAAGLQEAVVLADKRAVLANPGDAKQWARLVDSCVQAGDKVGAQRFAHLRTYLLGVKPDEKLVLKDGWSDLPAGGASPYRWIRRVPMKIDSALGVVAAGAALWLYDEGKGELVGVDASTGNVTERRALPGVRALLSDGKSIVSLVRSGKDKIETVLGGKRAVIAGLTDGLDGFSTSPVVKGVFYAVDDGLVRVDLTAGKMVWRNRALNPGVYFWRVLSERAMPVADGGDVFLAVDGKLTCVDASNGKVRWATACEAGGTPAVVGDIIVTGTTQRDVRGLNRKTGKTVWTYLIGSTARTRFVADGAAVFFGTGKGGVTALTASNGRLLWRRGTNISVRRPMSVRARPTSLLLHKGRLVAVNQHGYVEFNTRTGAILRRLWLPSARPLIVTPYGVMVETDPGRLVLVGPDGGSALGTPMLDQAAKLAAEKDKRAVAEGIARLALLYAQPGSLAGHKLLLEQGERGNTLSGRLMFAAMVANVDVYAAEARRLMREHLQSVPREVYLKVRVFGVVTRAHIARGSVPDAAQAFTALAARRKSGWALSELIKLRLAAGDRDGALAAARSLAAYGRRSAEIAFGPLVGGGMEEEALDLVAASATHKDAQSLMYRVIAISGNSGLFERAKDLLDRSAGHMRRTERAECYAYLLSNAGVAHRVLVRDGKRIAEELVRYRALLSKRREALKAIEQPERLKAVDRQIKLLEKVRFP